MDNQNIKEEARKGWAKREYIIGSATIAATVFLAISVVLFWKDIQSLEQYGYLGAFIISVLGGTTIIPVPAILVVFTLGGVLTPLFVGLAAGLGDTLGGLTVYLTGYGGRTAIQGKFENFYSRVMGWIQRRRGSLFIFIFSVLSPLFYPAGLAAGVLKFGIWRFFFITWAGKTIKCIAIAYAGFWGLRGLLRMMGMG